MPNQQESGLMSDQQPDLVPPGAGLSDRNGPSDTENKR